MIVHTMVRPSIAYTIVVSPASDPPVSAGPDVHLCPVSLPHLTATSAGSVTSYTWSDGTNTHSGATMDSQSSHYYSLYSHRGLYEWMRSDRSGDSLQKSTPGVTAFPPVSTICSTSDTVQITAIGTNAASYQWFPAAGLTCTTCPSPRISPTASTTYSVVAYDSAGCPSDTFHVTVNLNSPPPLQSCSVIYATPGGTGTGSQSSPANLPTALGLAQCNNATIKLAIGTYTIDYPITNIGSYTTIEGGFDPANNWIKNSTPGATTIYRSALNMEGQGTNNARIAIHLLAQAVHQAHQAQEEQRGAGNPNTGCNLSGAAGGAGGAGTAGTAGTSAPSTGPASPGTNTTFFNVAGQSGSGTNGGLGATGGYGGGGSFGIYLVNNGTSGNITDCNIVQNNAGTGGAGGTGQPGTAGTAGTAGVTSSGSCSPHGAGGTGGAGGNGGNGGNGQPGANGVSAEIISNGIVPNYVSGGVSTTIVTGINNPAAFNLAAQPTIYAANIHVR
ncbi:unnamed protein product [Sphagnum jensenii]|uniref:HYR domain-containing protein n=1 Tax=Sphagnum jensenii TaxID=128206 RepID=A0ABP0V5U7_9BRYO